LSAIQKVISLMKDPMERVSLAVIAMERENASSQDFVMANLGQIKEQMQESVTASKIHQELGVISTVNMQVMSSIYMNQKTVRST
jgi:hypothetical protein